MSETTTSPEQGADTIVLSEADKKERSRKNYAVGGALLAFVILTFFVTMAKLTVNFG